MPPSPRDGFDVVLFGCVRDAADPATTAPHAEAGGALLIGERHDLAALGGFVDVAAFPEPVLVALVGLAGAVLASVGQAVAVRPFFVKFARRQDALAATADGSADPVFVAFPF
jgi:hypothetical protein